MDLRSDQKLLSTKDYIIPAALLVLVILAPRMEPGLSKAARGRQVADWIALSQQIFVARVLDRETFSEAGNIMTRYSLRISEAFKGKPPEIAEVVEFGGTLRGVTMTVSHGARFQLGSDYLVFAWTDDSGRMRTVGGESGALPVIPGINGIRAVRLTVRHPLGALRKDGGSFLVRLDDIAAGITAVETTVETGRD